MFDVKRVQYVNLATFRKSGAQVNTPVWFAADGNDPKLLWAYTNATSGKVKRLRNSPRARVAPCDARGKLRGDWQDASARVITDPAEGEPGWDVLDAKYGWKMRLLLLGSRLGGRWKDRALVAMKLV